MSSENDRNWDWAKLAVVVVGRVRAVEGAATVNIQSKSQARRVVREAQAEANEQRAQRDRDNVDDMAAFLVARTRLAGVDECQAERVSQIGLEADRRRDEHRSECAAAVQRIRGRGSRRARSRRWPTSSRARCGHL